MTVIEVNEKETRLQTEMSTALEASKVLEPGTPEFDEAYSRYLESKNALVKIPEERQKALQAENAEKIAEAAKVVGDAVIELCTQLGVEALLGTPVIAYRMAKDSEGKIISVFNPITKVTTTGKKTGTRKGHTIIVTPEGERLSLTKFALSQMSESQKTEGSEDYVKYPHSLVDTKPKFDAFCESHNLTGYVYERPSDSEPENES